MTETMQRLSGATPILASATGLAALLAAIVATAGPVTTSAARCPFAAGQMLADTESGAPRGADIPIDHIVVVLQENRSFDHYFQALPAYGQPDVDLAPANASNLDRHGKPLGFELARTPCTAAF